MTRQRILFASYGASHINLLLPVLQSLASTGKFELRILALTTAYQRAISAGFDTIGFKDLIRQDDEKARDHGERLVEGLGSTLVSREESIAYLGLSYSELERLEGTANARRLYAEKGRAAFLPVETVGRAIDEWRPDLVVATNSPRAERAMICAAGQRGIPSLVIGDMFIIDSAAWVAHNGYGSRVAVMCDWVRRRLEGLGRDPADIAVTGNPSLDTLGSSEAVLAAERFRRELAWEGKKVITWAIPGVTPKDPLLQTIDRKIAILKSIADTIDDVRVILRPHPNNDIPFRNIGGKFFVSDRTQPIHSLIHLSDVVFSEYSSVATEAALVGKTVVTSGADDNLPFVELQLSTDVTDIEQLEQVLRRAILAPWQPRTDLLGMPELGTATANVVGEIERLLATAHRA